MSSEGNLVIHLDSSSQHGTALIAKDDSVWVVVSPSWWDFATRLWWWLCPANKKGIALLNTRDGKKVRANVIRVAHRHARFYGVPEKKEEVQA